MSKRYVHFTDLKGAQGIVKSGQLWQASYGPKGAVFAVIEGGKWVPSVQMSSMGRAKIRNVAIIFETDFLPDFAVVEEVMWHLEVLPIKIVKLTTPSVARKMLTGSIPEDPETELLQTPLHPAFNDLGDWTRMPEDFEPWVPGVDNKKYFSVREIFFDSKNIEETRTAWNAKTNKANNVTEKKIKKIINDVIKEMFAWSKS